MLDTLALTASDAEQAGEILRRGGIVAIPTETVYGLAANALNPDAVARVFEAKGRPQDNPLIVHIADLLTLPDVAAEFPIPAQRLANQFWPGPLTMVLPRHPNIPASVSAGLATVAVRFPAHPTAQAVIRAAGVPLAAPSANRSGHPSPTCADHVRAEMNGLVDAIVDGGHCLGGVESTVVSLVGERPRLLRPGGVTEPQLREVLPELEVDSAVFGEHGDTPPAAPGMKYRHYAPETPVLILTGDLEGVATRWPMHATDATLLLAPEEEAAVLASRLGLRPECVLTYGSLAVPESMARGLFAALWRVDERSPDRVLVRVPSGSGIESAVRNRLQKACGFQTL